MLEYFTSEIFDNGEPHLFKEVMIGVIEETLESENYDYEHRQSEKIIFVFGDKNLINQILDKVGLGPGKEGNKNHGDHRYDQFSFIGLEGKEKASENYLVGHECNLFF